MELREAISVPEMPQSWDESKMVQEPLIHFGANLVEQDHLTAVIRMIHPSVRIFLEKHLSSILTKEEHLVPGSFRTAGLEFCQEVCFKYLTLQDFGLELVPKSSVRTKVPSSPLLNTVLRGSRPLCFAGHFLSRKRSQQETRVVTFDRPKTPHVGIDTSPTYHFLAYIQEFWPFHARFLEPSDPAWSKFVAIAMSMNSSYRLHPWMVPGMTSDRFQHALFTYAVSTGTMSLMLALKDSVPKAKLLKFAKLGLDDQGNPAIHIAVREGHTQMLTWLIQVNGSEVLSVKNFHGDTALHVSAFDGKLDALKIILEDDSAKKILPLKNLNGDTALHASVLGGNVDSQETMLSDTSVEEFITDENKQGDTPFSIAFENKQMELLNKALLRILKLSPVSRRRLLQSILIGNDRRPQVLAVVICSKGLVEIIEEACEVARNLTSSWTTKTQALQALLENVLKSRPNATGRLRALKHVIPMLVKDLSGMDDQASWLKLAELALDDDVIEFFLALPRPSKHFWIRGTLLSTLGGLPRGTSILGKACTFSGSTTFRRIEIIRLLTLCLPEEELTWRVRIESQVAGKKCFNFSTPLSLALSGMALSKFAVDVVTILSDRFLKIWRRRGFWPYTMSETGLLSDGDASCLQQMTRIRPSAVEGLLKCGALKFQSPDFFEPRDNFLHIAVVQRDILLLGAILRYADSKSCDYARLLHALTRPSRTNNNAVRMAVGNDIQIQKLILGIAAPCIRADYTNWDSGSVKTRDGEIWFREALTTLLREVVDIMVQLTVEDRGAIISTVRKINSKLRAISLQEKRLEACEFDTEFLIWLRDMLGRGSFAKNILETRAGSDNQNKQGCAA